MRYLSKPLLFLVVFGLAGSSFAEAGKEWNRLANQISSTLGEAIHLYENGRLEEAKTKVQDAYFEQFEAYGMEMMVSRHIGSKRTFELEYAFGSLRKGMNEKQPPSVLKGLLVDLTNNLNEDAETLTRLNVPFANAGYVKGTQGVFESGFAYFTNSLIILFREGFEVILILTVLLSCLFKAGFQHRRREILFSAFAGVAASLVTAGLLVLFFQNTTYSQEFLEGLTMLFAACLLFYVGSWMIGQAQALHWQNFLHKQLHKSFQDSRRWTLWLVAFLAVYREGVETVIFYKALASGTDSRALSMIVAGAVVGGLLLFVVYGLLKWLGKSIPLKPFFWSTSIFLLYLSVTFIGHGVAELQEVGMIGVTQVPLVPVVTFLGLYPTLQTLLSQGFMSLLIIMTFVIYRRRLRLKGENYA